MQVPGAVMAVVGALLVLVGAINKLILGVISFQHVNQILVGLGVLLVVVGGFMALRSNKAGA